MPTATTAAKPPRVTKRRAETRARLMEAAFRVFAEKGYGHVTIEDVCEAAGYTRGAFYSQFESLEELFFLLYDQWAGRTADQVRAAMEGADAVVDLPGVVERIVDTLLLERDWLLIKFDFLLYSARNPELAHRWEVHRAQLRKVIEERLIASGIGFHKAIDSVTDTARAIIAAYDGVSVQLLLDRDQAAARAWLTQLMNVVLTRD
ncbi:MULTISPECIES: TetR/AcrR family transcriptional regulator [Mycobacterium]|jgi:AcrR family transcriptional regulator|uniref:TetR family transcriptional regulator n=1 Tax=Mycobacterium gordonae TaxID=1778 RepID=A0A1A6BJ29_MYCGO|nr:MULTISPECIES: TetR family transcriptional regulator [Mycobacterium]MBI2698618.1 TetR family transcriptional regulator [Mycobacterium sp.]MBX9981125.1 TetR family transcriptional regulator [Mycobacterium gordonae]MCQ4365077.1 TetR family transcriptional regulator [Mycobacterium gordonae]MCV7005843.1 TetR family transcriptional regulator [Mycobacterium gordonae]OBS02311.1 TetR family transcriptional regulator [Mycobacterium gordonae]